MLAIGVLCDRQDIYDEAMSYYKTGQGNGAGLQAVYHVHPGYLGQWQESGRDQGHCTLGIGLAGAFHEMAWNQGDDTIRLRRTTAFSPAPSTWRSPTCATATAPSIPCRFFTNINKQGTQSVLSTAGQGPPARHMGKRAQPLRESPGHRDALHRPAGRADVP